MDRKTARSSLSKAEYFTSAGDSFFEKKATGAPSTPPCDNTAPTATLEASVVRERWALGSGWTSLTASQRADLAARKEAAWAGDHSSNDFWLGTEAVKACRGASVAATPGRKR